MASREKGIFATKSGENSGKLGGILPKPQYFAFRPSWATRNAASRNGRANRTTSQCSILGTTARPAAAYLPLRFLIA